MGTIHSMQTITKAAIDRLISLPGKPKMTLYFPLLQRGNPAVAKENRHVFRVFLQDTTEKLTPWIPDASAREAFLQQTDTVLQDDDVWPQASGTLLILLDPQRCEYLWHPETLPQQAIVGLDWHLLPALPYLSQAHDFFLLLLSPNHVRLLHNKDKKIEEIPTEKFLPGNLEEVVGADHAQRMPQAISQHMQRGSATYFGHGEGIDDKGKELAQYVTSIDRGLCRLFPEPSMPLVVAAEQRLFDELKTRSHFKWLWPDCVAGNPSLSKDQDVIDTAKQLLEPYMNQQRNTRLEQYREGRNRQLTANELSDISKAAYAGQVQVIFLDEGTERIGHINPTTGAISFPEDPMQTSDMLNHTALTTWHLGGEVYTVPQGTFNDLSPVHALYRYG